MHHARELQDLNLKHEIIIKNHVRQLEESLLKRGERLERNLEVAQECLEGRLKDAKTILETLSTLKKDVSGAQSTCDSVEKSNEEFGVCLTKLRWCIVFIHLNQRELKQT